MTNKTKLKVLLFDIEPYYTVCVSDGEVRVSSSSKHSKGRLLTPFVKDGYLAFKINNKTKFAHGLVADYLFGERSSGQTVNHIDGNKLNNCPSNLEVCTIAENIKHAVRLGLHVSGSPERNGRYKDGRCSDIIAYKRNWYLLNRERILSNRKKIYAEAKA